jgi:hypothetical protein
VSDTHDEFEARPELVQKRARAILWTRIAYAAAAVFVIVSLTLLVANALSSFKTRDTLLDCTAPEGKCYKDGQQRTGVFIQQLIDANHLDESDTRRIVVLAAACAKLYDTVDDIQACVDKNLPEEKK